MRLDNPAAAADRSPVMEHFASINVHGEPQRAAREKVPFRFHFALALILALATSALCALSLGLALDGTVGGSIAYKLFSGFGVLLYAFAAFTIWRLLFLRVHSLAASARKGGAGGGAAPPSASSSTKSPPPDAGSPVPVTGSPKHHLVAAKALPPSDKTHVYPKD